MMTTTGHVLWTLNTLNDLGYSKWVSYKNSETMLPDDLLHTDANFSLFWFSSLDYLFNHSTNTFKPWIFQASLSIEDLVVICTLKVPVLKTSTPVGETNMVQANENN